MNRQAVEWSTTMNRIINSVPFQVPCVAVLLVFDALMMVAAGLGKGAHHLSPYCQRVHNESEITSGKCVYLLSSLSLVHV